MLFLVRSIVIGYVLVVALSATVSAQTRIAGSLEELGRGVGPGADVTVTDRYGSEFPGFITALTPTELTVFVGGAPRVFRQGEILRIRERRNDSLVNGTLAGFGIGAGFVLGATIIASIANYYVDEGKTARVALAFGGCGAGIGALIDALHKSRAVIYEKPPTGSLVDYRFQILPDRKTMALVWRF
jgi:hypothetical protein